MTPAKCARCSSPLSPTDRVCGDCGLRICAPPAPARCGSCGASLAADERFCGSCGASASTPSAAAARVPAPTAPSASTPFVAPSPPARAASAADPRPAGNGKSGAEVDSVLYVVPEAHARTLGALLELHGEVLAVPPSAQALTLVQARLRRPGRPDAVCLLGGDHELPMTSIEDPCENDDALLTDNFFGRENTPSPEERFTGDLLPEVPVSRIPSLEPALVARLLSDAPDLHPDWQGGYALSAAVWEGASRAVAEMIFGAAGPRLRLSPPDAESHVAAALASRPGRLFFNVHGSGDEPQWVGEGAGRNYVGVLTGRSIAAAPGAVVVSEACYGARGFPEDGGGLADHFLRAGAASFVGSTIIAWGPPSPPPGSADLIVVGFYLALDDGCTASQALLVAKRFILENELENGRGLDNPAHNTLLSFVHYGAPHARASGGAAQGKAFRSALPTVGARPGAATKAAGGSSALDRIRARMSGAGGAGSVLSAARGRLAARLSPGDWQTLSAGRVALAQLPSEFREYARITSAFRDLLGAEPKDVSVFRYRAGAQRLSQVSASTKATWGGVKAATLLVDESGRELRRWVSR